MSQPLTILGRKNSVNVMKTMWAAAELGLSVNRQDVGGPFGYDHVPEYPGMNPNMRVPTMIDGGLILWESNVIVRYLAEKHGRGSLWPEEPATRWEAEKWMDWQHTTLSIHMSNILYHTVRLSPEERDENLIETSRVSAIAGWKILDAHLADRAFVTGDSFTMGDIPLGCHAYRWHYFAIERPELPNLKAWYERLQERPAYREHVLQPLS